MITGLEDAHVRYVSIFAGVELLRKKLPIAAGHLGAAWHKDAHAFCCERWSAERRETKPAQASKTGS
jgi:hypothetical protein